MEFHLLDYIKIKYKSSWSFATLYFASLLSFL